MIKNKVVLKLFVCLLICLIPQSVLALTPKDLWRSDGQLNIAGKWVFYVGPKKIPYRVFLKQQKNEEIMASYLLTGYMLSPQGKRFDFHKGESNHGATGNSVFSMALYEGESEWMCFLNKKSPKLGMWWEGEVRHIHTNQLQAKFIAHKLSN